MLGEPPNGVSDSFVGIRRFSCYFSQFFMSGKDSQKNQNCSGHVTNQHTIGPAGHASFHSLGEHKLANLPKNTSRNAAASATAALLQFPLPVATSSRSANGSEHGGTVFLKSKINNCNTERRKRARVTHRPAPMALAQVPQRTARVSRAVGGGMLLR